MRSRKSPPSNFGFSFGPEALTPAVRLLVYSNVGGFVLSYLFAGLGLPINALLGLSPADVFERLAVWQLVTYMFLHGGIFHLLFNMLALWMFGVELERTWGSRYFIKYYFITGIGAAVVTLVLSLTPLPIANQMYGALTIGASGAIYGILLAYGLYFPNRPIYMYLVFPIPAKYFVMIVGAISFLSSMGGPEGGVAHSAHLGGLVVGYLYLKGGRARPWAEVKYRYLKWRIDRSRRRFDVYPGGRTHDVNRRVH